MLYSRYSPLVEIAVATFTNSHRKELTGDERKAFAAEVGRWAAQRGRRTRTRRNPVINEEHCRLCGEVVDDSGGDGLCEACYFAHADPEWIREHYPWRQDEPDDSDVLDD